MKTRNLLLLALCGLLLASMGGAQTSGSSGTKYDFETVASDSLVVDFCVKATPDGPCLPPSGVTTGKKECKPGFFRVVPGKGDCVPRTCDNGGLGEQDCEQDDDPPVDDPPDEPQEGTPLPACNSDQGTKATGRFLIDGFVTWANGDTEEATWAKFSNDHTLYNIRRDDCDCMTAAIKVVYACNPKLKAPSVRLTFAPTVASALLEWTVEDAATGMWQEYRKPSGGFEVERLVQGSEGSEPEWRSLYLGHHDYAAFPCVPGDVD